MWKACKEVGALKEGKLYNSLKMMIWIIQSCFEMKGLLLLTFLNQLNGRASRKDKKVAKPD